MGQTEILTPAKTPWQAYAVLVVGIISVSMSAIFIRLAQAEGLPSLLIAAARLTIAALLLTLPTLRRYTAQIRGLSRVDLLLAGGSGIFLALHFATWIASLEYVSVLVSVVLVTTSPLWVALLEVVFLRARLGLFVIIGLGVAFCGGLLIGLPAATCQLTLFGDSQMCLSQLQLNLLSATTSAGSAPLFGGILALLGAVTVAVYLIIGRKLRAQLDLFPYIWLVYGCAALTLIVVLLFAGITITGYSAEGYFWLLMLGLIPQLIGHSSWNYALRYFPATYVSIASQLEPIFSAILAFVIFTEIPANLQIIGSGIILLGVLLATLGQARQVKHTKVVAPSPAPLET